MPAHAGWWRDLRRGIGATRFLLAAWVFVSVLCLVLEPRWETNDDVAMAMVAHGFGIAAVPSATIVFSSVVWGHLVQAIGSVGGVSGYTIGGYACLVLAGGVLLWAGRRCGLGLVGAVGLFFLLLLRPVLLPQFTLTAGLLMVASACCLALYPQRRSAVLPWLAALLALASYLVRREEFLLVAVVAAPVLPWTLLARDAGARWAAGALVCAIAACAYADHAADQGEEWRAFKELNGPRAAFTDFGRAQRLKANPELMGRFHFTRNDVELIENWFFADPVLVEPARMRAVLEELGEVRAEPGTDWRNTVAGLKSLGNERFFWALACALLLAILLPSWQVALAWLLCAGAFATIGYLGRSGTLRVYDPLVAALVLAPLLRAAWQPAGGSSRRRWFAPLVALVFTGAAVGNGLPLVKAVRDAAAPAEAARHEVMAFPRETVVIWGAGFPFESVYAPFARHVEKFPPRMYGLGGFTLAPFSVPYAESREGRDMLTMMQGPGMLAMAGAADLDRLAVYCREHYDAALRDDPVHGFSFGTVRRLRCPGSPAGTHEVAGRP